MSSVSSVSNSRPRVHLNINNYTTKKPKASSKNHIVQVASTQQS
jgi:hypothetical protein